MIPYSAKDESTRKKMQNFSPDGFCAMNNGIWHIFYNDEVKKYERINNTILHEIGHIVLGHTEYSEVAEKEAKFFAKYALVPPILVERLGIKSFERIIDAFGVSYEAAYYAWDYYLKWSSGNTEHSKYELRMLKLFGKFLAGGGVN